MACLLILNLKLTLAELELEAGSEGGDFDYSMNEGGLEVAQDLINIS